MDARRDSYCMLEVNMSDRKSILVRERGHLKSTSDDTMSCLR